VALLINLRIKPFSSDVRNSEKQKAAPSSCGGFLSNLFQVASRVRDDAEHALDDKFQQIYPVESWIGYITDYLSTSPILRDHVEEYQRWYSPELLSLKRAADEALRRNADTL
jgi:hypothetical protein